jgi:hypothetical protein
MDFQRGLPATGLTGVLTRNENSLTLLDAAHINTWRKKKALERVLEGSVKIS